MSPVLVFGHRAPDNDSISSAVAYAHLKNVTDPERIYLPVRANISSVQTRYSPHSADWASKKAWILPYYC